MKTKHFDKFIFNVRSIAYDSTVKVENQFTQILSDTVIDWMLEDDDEDLLKVVIPDHWRPSVIVNLICFDLEDLGAEGRVLVQIASRSRIMVYRNKTIIIEHPTRSLVEYKNYLDVNRIWHLWKFDQL